MQISQPMKKITFLLLFAGILVAQSQSIVVNDPADPQTAFTAEEMIQNVLVSGSSCVDIELTVLAENPDGIADITRRSWGYFKDGGTDFPFEEGIILSTGFGVSAEGPNIETGTSDQGTAGNWLGDVDIETILDNQYGTNVSTNNATVFEFTFVSSINEVNFEFLFASEEYENEFECSDQFRDGFAFLIKGPGIPDDSGTPFGGTNIAAITGSTNVPVSTATIHLDPADDLVNGFLCGGEILGTNYFPELYISNFNDNLDDVAIEFDGLTAVLTTTTVAIQPNEVYSVKLVIADRGDESFDSAVFLNAGSFNIGNTDLGDDILLGSGNAVCEGETITLDAGEDPNATYTWTVNGNVIAGEISSTLDISETGLYGVTLAFNNSECVITDEILVEFFPIPEFDLGEDQLICDDEMIILDATPSNLSELTDVTYAWFQDGTLLPAETNPTLDIAVSGTYAVEVTGNDCVATDEIVITLNSFTVDIGDEVILCGEESFEIVPLIEGGDPTNAIYEWSTGAITPTITVTTDGTYSVDVTIDGCTKTDMVMIEFRTLPIIELGPTVTKCSQDIVTLIATPSNVDPAAVSYVWFLDGGVIEGETGMTLDATEAGIYAVEVSDQGCTAADDVVVEFYDNANCIITQGISPNSDGMNDFLDLEFLDDRSDILKLSIYSRLGRLIYEKVEYVNEWGGTTNDGNLLPDGTYFYAIDLANDETITGYIYINKEN